MAEWQSQELIAAVGTRKTVASKNSQKRRRKSSVVVTLPPADGGYGWVVVAVCFYILLLTGGTIMCYGIIYVEFLDYFQETRTKTSLIGSLTLLSISIAGPLSSALCLRFGHRAVVMTGGVVSAISMAASASADSVYFLYASFGIFGGLGIGLCTTPSIALVTLYFDKRRSSAIAIAFSGAGISYLVFPSMMDACINSLTWRGTMFILASLWLQCCVGGILLRPITVREDVFLDRRMSVYTNTAVEKKEQREPVEEMKVPPGACDMELFRNWVFWLYLLQEFLWHIDFMNFPTILPDFAMLNGFDRTDSGILLTIFGSVAVPARLLGGYMSDRIKMNPLILLLIFITIMGGLNIVFPFTGSSFPMMAVVCGARGALNGLLPVIGPSILVFLFTTEHMTNALGYAILAIGAGQLIAPPVGGIIYDQTGDYMYAYLMCAFVTFLAVLLTVIVLVDSQRTLRLRKDAERQEGEEPPEAVGLRESQ